MASVTKSTRYLYNLVQNTEKELSMSQLILRGHYYPDTKTSGEELMLLCGAGEDS